MKSYKSVDTDPTLTSIHIIFLKLARKKKKKTGQRLKVNNE